MRVIRRYGLTIGGFLAKLFDSKRSHTKVNHATRSQLGQWLKGTTVAGTRPVDIVDAIRVHPYSTPRNPNGSIIHPSTTTHSSRTNPPKGFASHPRVFEPTSATTILESDSDSEASTSDHPAESPRQAASGTLVEEQLLEPGTSPSKFAYHALEEWAVHRVRVRVEKEASALVTSPALRTVRGVLSWDTFLGFSIATVVSTLMHLAPVLWSIVTTVAIKSSPVIPDSAESDSDDEPDLDKTTLIRPLFLDDRLDHTAPDGDDRFQRWTLR